MRTVEVLAVVERITSGQMGSIPQPVRVQTKEDSREEPLYE